jgi:NADH-quinone oxidoreductase subunit N
VDLYDLIRRTIEDATGPSLRAFLPELILSTTIVLLLLGRMIFARWKRLPYLLMFAGTAAALVALYLTLPGQAFDPVALVSHDASTLAANRPESIPIFTGMLVYDPFSLYMRGLLLTFVLLFALLTSLSGVPDEQSATEFYVLVLGAVLGMALMVAANHMMIVFLGVEMASVPSYALAGLLRHRRQSSEAALKFAVFGGATAGVMLYGISLLVGALGSAHLPTMAQRLGEMIPAMSATHGSGQPMVLVLAGLMIMVGLAFKLSAVPFHFWAPDVFEGATAEIGAFLSVASKAAALGLLVRLAAAFSGATPEIAAKLEPARFFLSGLIVLLAAVTCTLGNLAAYGQTNLKRLLAYSTIAHAGYMMMPVAAAVWLAGSRPDEASGAIAGLAFYIAIYLFMNLAAFAAAAFLRNRFGSEQIDDYAGLVQRSPGFVLCFALVLVSLVGLPPLAGFAAKFAIFKSLVDANLMVLLAIAVVNTVVSLFYYLRVIRVMVMNPAPAGSSAELPLGSPAGLYYFALTVPVVLFGVWWNGLFQWAAAAAAPLFASMGAR